MRHIIILFSLIYLVSCGAPKEVKKEIKEKSLDKQMMEAYNEGLEALEQGDIIFATRKFNEAELLFPQSEWAPRSSLMAAYAFWSQGYYRDSISELKRFLKLYPKYQNLDYVYYLLAMNYYDSIVNEKKDLRPLLEAKKYFTLIIENYSDTDYALDAKYKLELIKDILAAKEMYIARHYIKKEKWIPAINRLKIVISNYKTTVYVEEALHRLVEINYIIGLEDEAKRYAYTLGYNYQSSKWYKQTYKIFNEDYNIKQKIEKKEKDKKKNKLIDKIRSFF